MAQTYKMFIGEDVIQKHFQDKYGKKYKLKLDIEYQYRYKSLKVDIGFTADKKAFWAFRYKKEVYMNIIEDIELKDKYTTIDVYTTLAENAVESYNQMTEMARLKRNIIKRKKK